MQLYINTYISNVFRFVYVIYVHLISYMQQLLNPRYFYLLGIDMTIQHSEVTAYGRPRLRALVIILCDRDLPSAGAGAGFLPTAASAGALPTAAAGALPTAHGAGALQTNSEADCLAAPLPTAAHGAPADAGALPTAGVGALPTAGA